MSEIFAKRLREVRENKRKTQVGMGRVVGLTSVAYGGWERGEAEPSFANLIKICEYLDVSADWLLGIGKDNESKPMITARINALKSEADQAAATLARLVGQIKEMEKSV